MVTVIVQFKLPSPVSPEKARELFLASAPNYQKITGLLRKFYLLGEDGCSAGGVYIWESKSAAEKLFDAEWKQFIRDKYNAEAEVSYFVSPVQVDNLTGEIISD